jgi:SPP1 gp7 family putative phage head morphogenesis protein
MKDTLFNWANDWGRTVGIYGVKTKLVDPGHHDDLDAFRHAFCHAVLVSVINLARPDLFIKWLATFNISRKASEIIGDLMEHPEMGSSAEPCPKQMDLHNNDIGKNLGLTQGEMLRIIGQGDEPLTVLAERVAQAIKQNITINRLDDPRMPINCFSTARVPAGEYIWRTQGDDKVRFEHAVLNGKVFHMDKPPADGNPGSAYNCRCYAEPVHKTKK